MDIFETLRLEHAAIQDMLDQVIDRSSDTESLQMGADQGDDWPSILHDFKLALLAHDRAEEAVVYEFLRQIPHRGETADLKTEEHHLAEELLEDLEEINPADRAWATKLGLLKNQIESHIAEEETTIFSLLQPHITDEMSDKMAVDFERLRDDIVTSTHYHPKGRSNINPAGLDLDT